MKHTVQSTDQNGSVALQNKRLLEYIISSNITFNWMLGAVSLDIFVKFRY